MSGMQTLRLFADVARCHSFSQAAVRHGITQSAASQRIGQLERRLGVTLIDRSVRPLELTEAGRAFLSGCDDILERYDRLERKIAGPRPGGETGEGALEGVVRVEAIYSAGIDLLNEVRERFEARHPRVRVEIRYDKPDGVYRAVRAGDCDLGILSYPQRWGKVGIIGLRDETMVVVCRPDHALAGRRIVGAADLSGHAMAAFEADLPVGRAIRQYLREQNGTPGPKIANEFDNIDTIKAAVAVTDEVAILPRRTVIREVAAGTLAMAELEPRLVRPLGIIFRPSGRPRKRDVSGESPQAAFSEAVRAFVELLIDHAGPSIDLSDQAARETQGELVGARA